MIKDLDLECSITIQYTAFTGDTDVNFLEILRLWGKKHEHCQEKT